MNGHNPALPDRCDVAIVGGGTAGLALAAELKRQGVKSVVVLEREASAGGVPRHCGHYPFGLREYGRLLKGPAYAQKNVAMAQDLGAQIFTATTVTHLGAGGVLDIATENGTTTLRAARVVLCTGVREASRAQRFIGGDRTRGVMTTGALQSFVYLKGVRPFQRPVILGSELVSFSAVSTCQHLGITPVAMIEENPHIVARRIVRPYLMLKGIPLYQGAISPRIIGGTQVEAIEFTDGAGKTTRIDTDGVIVSGRFRPESALLRNSPIEIDPCSGGPVIDQFGQCSDPAYYSTGNMLGPAETSGWCWREGVQTARRVAQDLAGIPEARGSIRLGIDDSNIQYVVPQKITVTDRKGGLDHMQIGLARQVNGLFTARQHGRTILATPLKSNPVRRINIPLGKITATVPTADVKLTIESRT